jgi:hypothetical protein
MVQRNLNAFRFALYGNHVTDSITIKISIVYQQNQNCNVCGFRSKL